MSKSKDQVIIFDTTLRDGEQSPGATMTFDEKLQVAALLDEMLVDVIEAGFPIASEGDFEAVSGLPGVPKIRLSPVWHGPFPAISNAVGTR